VGLFVGIVAGACYTDTMRDDEASMDTVAQLRACLSTLHDSVELLCDAVDPEHSSVAVICESLAEQLRTAVLLASTFPSNDVAPLHPVVCDPLQQMQLALRSLDDALQRVGVRHHVTVQGTIPTVMAAPERLTSVCVSLIDFVLRLADAAQGLHINFSEMPVRQGSGVACALTVTAPNVSERDRYLLFEVLGGVAQHRREAADAESAAIMERLQFARRWVDDMGGELWAESGAARLLTLMLVLPTVRQETESAPRARCKLDIVLCAPQQLRDRLLQERLALIEQRARQVIRHPRDTVMVFAPRGAVSVMLTATPADAQRVVERIELALTTPVAGEPALHLGTDVELHLTAL